MNQNNNIPSDIKKIYLMAICGTGMGSLAGLLKNKGYTVAGSDNNVYPPMSTQLQNQGIEVYSPYSAENIKNFQPDLIIVGNAISATHEEAAYLLSTNIPYISMPQALHHFFLRSQEVIVISGTHGKTTTSALMAYLLSAYNQDPSFMIGGVVKNFSQNFNVGSGRYFVIEGDEYDTAFFDKGPKFLHYNPCHVVITSLEFDHADIYANLDQIKTSFQKLTALIPAGGSLHYCTDYPAIEDVKKNCQGRVFSYGSTGDWKILHFQGTPTGSTFDLSYKNKLIIKVNSPLTGMYNAQNVLACASVLHHLGFDLLELSKHLQNFLGIKRRQEILYDSPTMTVIDDFAHHPTAVEKTIGAIKEKFPSSQLIAVFEPRSNTSMRHVFQNDYPKSFMKSDYTIISKVFNPQKVKDGNILNVQKIIDDLHAENKLAYTFSTTQDIVDYIIEIKRKSTHHLVTLIMSNGGFDNIHQKLIHACQTS